jgi:hypothetical protein
MRAGVSGVSRRFRRRGAPLGDHLQKFHPLSLDRFLEALACSGHFQRIGQDLFQLSLGIGHQLGGYQEALDIRAGSFFSKGSRALSSTETRARAPVLASAARAARFLRAAAQSADQCHRPQSPFFADDHRVVGVDQDLVEVVGLQLLQLHLTGRRPMNSFSKPNSTRSWGVSCVEVFLVRGGVFHFGAKAHGLGVEPRLMTSGKLVERPS